MGGRRGRGRRARARRTGRSPPRSAPRPPPPRSRPLRRTRCSRVITCADVRPQRRRCARRPGRRAARGVAGGRFGAVQERHDRCRRPRLRRAVQRRAPVVGARVDLGTSPDQHLDDGRHVKRATAVRRAASEAFEIDERVGVAHEVQGRFASRIARPGIRTMLQKDAKQSQRATAGERGGVHGRPSAVVLRLGVGAAREGVEARAHVAFQARRLERVVGARHHARGKSAKTEDNCRRRQARGFLCQPSVSVPQIHTVDRLPGREALMWGQKFLPEKTFACWPSPASKRLSRETDAIRTRWRSRARGRRRRTMRR